MMGLHHLILSEEVAEFLGIAGELDGLAVLGPDDEVFVRPSS